MDQDLKYPWQQAVLDAFMALLDSLAVKINVGERAISARLSEQNQVDGEERVALQDALRVLKVLIQEAKVHTRSVQPKKKESVA